MKSGSMSEALGSALRAAAGSRDDFQACQEAYGALLSTAVCLHCSGGLSAAGGRLWPPVYAFS